MSHADLYQLERQFETTVDAPVNAPTGVEVAQAVQSRVLRRAAGVGDRP
jgi:hypothetical protein